MSVSDADYVARYVESWLHMIRATYDTVDNLRDRYVRGDMSLEQFEQRVGDVVAREAVTRV